MSRIAREQKINAEIAAGQDIAPAKAAQSTATFEATVPAGVIELVIGTARLRFEGRVNETVFAQVLAHLLQ